MNSSWTGTLGRHMLALLLGGALISACLLYVWVFVFPNHPSRPANVPKSATLVLMGWSHFWQECRFDSTQHQDTCRIYSGNGVILHDEVFLPLNGGGAIQEDQLRIAPGGNSYSVHLLNGVVLIPQKNFDEIRRELQGDFSGAK
jgi:hypothetical protein